MTDPISFRSIIELWPTREAMAAEVGRGCTASQVSKWWQRGRIPDEWWSAVLATEKAKGRGLNADLMVVLAARPEWWAAEVRA